MIDLHCHILPSIDDGPETIKESLDLANVLSRAGYRIITATPHMIPGTIWMPAVDEIQLKVNDLNLAIAKLRLDLTIATGMEIAIDPQIPDMLEQGALLPLGDSSCLLIEPPFQQLPPGWEKVVFTILAKGYTVLLAHPERCAQLAVNPAMIEKIIDSGVYLQINYGSFLGMYGRTAARAARLMATNGWIHCLATDSHHSKGPIPDQMQSVMAKLANLIGEENIQQLTLDNPQRLLCGKTLPKISISPVMNVKKKPWWRFRAFK